MSACCCIDLNEERSISKFADRLDEWKIDGKTEQTIREAVGVLRQYKETLELSPREVMLLYSNLQISDAHTPTEMNERVVTNERAYVIQKRFFESHISKKKFESTLFELVYELAKTVAGDILHAIVSLVKSFSIICLECQSMATTYKEVSFKFYARDEERHEILMLIINLDYGLKDKAVSAFQRMVNYARFGLHLSFFGAVVRTSLPDEEKMN